MLQMYKYIDRVVRKKGKKKKQKTKKKLRYIERIEKKNR